MGTTFEIVVHGEEQTYARQAARAAFRELRGLEEELSRFIPCSDVAQINRLRAGEVVRVGPATLECLELARRVHSETNGAFDVTIGPLLACWLAEDGTARTPTDDDLAEARARTGMSLLSIQPGEHMVGLERDGVVVDLGGIGKGYAVDRLAEFLRDWEIGDALIHSGESTALAMGSWSVAIRDPGAQAEGLERFSLRDRALSGSGIALHGAHILDPRTGRPAGGKLATWAAAPNAALSDALSTAFMVMSPDEVGAYCAVHPEVSAILLSESGAGREVIRFGSELA